MTAPAYQPFNATTVPLRGSNLIEASAGTGKTYSIAILVLRLVLEEGLPVKDILMVTFTKAAVAELEDRIRRFLRSAYKASRGEAIFDGTIKSLVEEAIEKQGESKVQGVLKEALLFLDETSVLTIHSFCQQTLAEFAFETGQVFGAETLKDPATVLAEEINKFWRREITTLPVALLAPLIAGELSQAGLTAIVKEHLDGKKFIHFDENEPYTACEEDHQAWIQELVELQEKEAELRACLEQHLRDHRDELEKISAADRYAKKSLLPLVDRPQDFLAQLVKSRGSGYVQKLYPDLLERHDACDDVLRERNALVRRIMDHLYCRAIRQVAEGLEAYKHRNNLQSFDDMIKNLHASLVGGSNDRLVAALQGKYRAVFIDEFQDTDRLQYDIFDKAFGKGPVLFYIGDPKQSIYAWRKADIFTYFKARETVDNVYGMNHNFRSSPAFIAAMNAFFLPTDGFDTFHFSGSGQAIAYIPVQAPEGRGKEPLFLDGEACTPLTFFPLPNKNAICAGVAGQVVALLSEGYTLGAGGRRVGPADIGILVRSNGEGRDIKAALAARGIPAVTIADDKVLQSEEAVYLLYLLKAMEDPTPAHINRALLSPFTGFTAADIRALNDEQAVLHFKQYKNTWDEDGVYTALMDFVAGYRVRQVLLQPSTEGGERIITNLFQLIELVHKVQTYKKLSPLELLGWLKRGIEGMETEGDEYEQRVESDEEAIKIVTIHKSKGLEYNIVLAPFLDFVIDKPRIRHCSFRHPETGEYIAAHKDVLTPEQQEWLQTQTEQENRRLLYVALTRAARQCYVFRNEFVKKSTLVPFLAALAGTGQGLIALAAPPAVPEGYAWGAEERAQPTAAAGPVRFGLVQHMWRRMSYTGLAAAHESSPKGRGAEAPGAYDDFVFHQLAKGSQTGNLLHYLFEQVHFADNSRWETVVKEALLRFAPRQEERYLPLLQELLAQVLNATIQVGGESFQLAQVDFHKRLHEFEFDFPVPLFQPQLLHLLSDGVIQVAVKRLPLLEGIMNGKMDLFFECKGKYFILDWKSNYLGDTLEAYGREQLLAVMNENNYHLQYLLYTLAAAKYLESRLPGFDYERDFGGVVYLFIRGVRREGDTGIYTCRPTVAQLQRLQDILEGKVPTALKEGSSLPVDASVNLLTPEPAESGLV
ncbi:UvrD-helicase domain-containing protein [Paraflavisolibacter sp. H34]|uniref:UvrD-helicase domain-containing protein n=1 Tax=Huijunlia imazamoxiresistens TaxID=3127457 RepID=UPI003016B1DE